MTDARRAFTAGTVLSLLGFAALLVTGQLPHPFIDLHVYLAGGDAILGGQALTDVTGETNGRFTYPPFAALLFAVPALLPVGLVDVGWMVVLMVALAVAGWVTVRPATPRWAAVLAGLTVPWTVPMFNGFRFGQIGLVLCVLVLADVWLLKRRSPLAGALIGLATAIKLTPGVFILWLLGTGRWRAAATACTVFAGTVVAGLLATPADAWRFWTEDLWHTQRVGPIDTHRNLSVFGLLTQWGAPERTAMAAHVLVAIAGLVAAVVLTRRHGLAVGVFSVGVLSALASPIAWSHHYFWLVLAAVAALGAGRRWTPVVALLAVLVLAAGGGLAIGVLALGFVGALWIAAVRDQAGFVALFPDDATWLAPSAPAVTLRG